MENNNSHSELFEPFKGPSYTEDKWSGFSEFSQTGIIPKDINKKYLLACLLRDWGNTYAGHKPPPNFGIAMVEASEILGVPADPESLMKLAESNTI